MSKKMCQHRNNNNNACRAKGPCPKNTNSKCEIVQPKKRTRTVRVWALKGNPRYCAPVKYENFCIPATLTYEVKEEGAK